jgi:hypothetical protein
MTKMSLKKWMPMCCLVVVILVAVVAVMYGKGTMEGLTPKPAEPKDTSKPAATQAGMGATLFGTSQPTIMYVSNDAVEDIKTLVRNSPEYKKFMAEITKNPPTPNQTGNTRVAVYNSVLQALQQGLQLVAPTAEAAVK